MKKRVAWIDISKGIAILLMIIGHEISGRSSLYGFIFSFHMPLFFILSGYTAKLVKNYERLWNNVRKMIVHIWLLAALMVFLYRLEYLFVYHISVWVMIKQSIIGIFWGSNLYHPHQVLYTEVMWFLFAYFWARILFDYLQVIINIKYVGVVLGLLSYLSYLVSLRHWLPQTLDIVPIAALFMWVGAMWKNIEQSNMLNRNQEQLVVLIFFIGWIAMVQNNIHIEMATRWYPYFIFSIVEAVMGTYVISFLSKALVSCGNFRIILQFFGKNTLALLCIHQLDFYRIIGYKVLVSPGIAVLTRMSVDIVVLIVLIGIKHLYKELRRTK